jgi:hypothetical protein
MCSLSLSLSMCTHKYIKHFNLRINCHLQTRFSHLVASTDACLATATSLYSMNEYSSLLSHNEILILSLYFASHYFSHLRQGKKKNITQE